MDQELVACVERLVFARTPGPEAGEVLALALVDVDLLKVLDQLLSLAVNSAAVQPAAAVSSADVLLLVLLQHRRKDPEVVWDRSVMCSRMGSIGRWRASRRARSPDKGRQFKLKLY